jgi:peptide/nickel transport system permease protein
MDKDTKNKLENKPENSDQMALDDVRRVRILSPSALVLKRFMRNRLAIVGSVIIISMFLFSFLGGLLISYAQSQLFMKEEYILRDYAHATYSADILTTAAEGYKLSVTARGTLVAAIKKGQDTAKSGDESYSITPLRADASWLVDAEVVVASGRKLGSDVSLSLSDGFDLPDAFLAEAVAQFNADAESFTWDGTDYRFQSSGRQVLVTSQKTAVLASRLVLSVIEPGFKTDYDLLYGMETAIAAGRTSFDGYDLREINGGYVVSQNGADKFIASPLSVQPQMSDVVISLSFREAIENAIQTSAAEFTFENEDYTIAGANGVFAIKKEQVTQLISRFESPSAAHVLGTDGVGMDVVTRLMYGGRISLMVGFVVVFLMVIIGIVMGGIAGYFGKFLDSLIMRLVDIFNCIPTMPLYMIIGAVMDGNKVDPSVRIYFLMLIMGFMSWPYIARVVRGQILSLREQEFMVATEATGVRVSRRIFRHLIPNAIPQLIVLATMGLGDVILAESALSFLGLGVKFPLASWGNILNSVNDMHIMTTYPAVWLPAGILILLTVLGFNFIGDGLRDAFDPKMKR